jgi:PAS domain-containing protein
MFGYSTEESLGRSEAAYSMMPLMCDNVPDLIWAKDLERRFLFVNRAICEKLLIAGDTAEPLGKDDMSLLFGKLRI